MEKDCLSIKKVVKNYEINERLKQWARVRIAVNSYPAAVYRFRRTLWTIHPSLISSSRKSARVKTMKIRKIQPSLFFTVCLNVTFTDNWKNLRT